MKSNKLNIFIVIISILLIISRLPFFLDISGKMTTPVVFSIVLFPFIIMLYNRTDYNKMIGTSIWIILSFFLLVIFNILKYGNTNGLLTHTLVLFISIPFYFLGYKYGLYNNKKYLKYIINILYLIVFLYSTYFLLFGSSVLGNEYNFIGLTRGYFILYWPFVFIVSSLGLNSIIMSKEVTNKKLLLVYGVSYFVIFMSIVKSGYTSPIILYIIFIIVFVVLKDKLSIRKILYILFAFAVVYIAILVIIKGSFFGFQIKNTKEIRAFIYFLQGSDRYGMETAANGRLSLLSISIDSFMESPLVGKGGFWSIGVRNGIASQHSSILDFLAFYGLLGMSFLMIYIKFIKEAYVRNRKVIKHKFSDNLNLLFLSVLIAIFTLSFLDPYLLTFIPSDSMIFLMGGYVAGLAEHEKLKKIGRNIYNLQSLYYNNKKDV